MTTNAWRYDVHWATIVPSCLKQLEPLQQMVNADFCSQTEWHDLCEYAAEVALEALLAPSCGKSPGRSTLDVP
jgi:hypothetical protein